MKYTPLGVAAAVGVMDGVIDEHRQSQPAGTKSAVPYPLLAYEVGVVALGFVSHKLRKLDPNANYAMMTGGTAILFSRIPGAIHAKSLHVAFGDSVNVSDALAATVVPPRALLPGGTIPGARPINELLVLNGQSPAASDGDGGPPAYQSSGSLG